MMSAAVRQQFDDLETRLKASVGNEMLTRQRVDMIERRLAVYDFAMDVINRRGFWGRLRWLFTGR